MASVEIFTITRNGEYILPLYLKHYQESFPGCKINIFDNHSTDRTWELCQNAGCNMDIYPKFTIALERKFKNTIWKKSTADWVIVCDQDELVQITAADLDSLPQTVNVVQFKGYNMVDVEETKDPMLFTHGYHSETYDKCCMFRPSLKEINFSPGSHFCEPCRGVFSRYEYLLFHYNQSWFSFANFCNKHKHAFRKDLERVYNLALEKVVKLK